MLHPVSMPDIRDRAAEQYCSKCDSPLLAQSDGSTLTRDIAHHRETIPQALEKFEQAVDQAWQGHAARIRLIVGNGAIRDAVLAELHFLQSRGVVLDHHEEGGNRGAVLVRIR